MQALSKESIHFQLTPLASGILYHHSTIPHKPLLPSAALNQLTTGRPSFPFQ